MRKLALALLPLAFSVQSAHADAPIATGSPTYKPLAMTVDTLDNGLRVVVVPMTGSPTVAFYTLVMAGSRDEVEAGRSGYAHLFEHLMFRGTQKVPASDYEKKMQSMGADNNAFTTDDFTFYVPLIPKESLADLVPVEADRFQHLVGPELHASSVVSSPLSCHGPGRSRGRPLASAYFKPEFAGG